MFGKNLGDFVQGLVEAAIQLVSFVLVSHALHLDWQLVLVAIRDSQIIHFIPALRLG